MSRIENDVITYLENNPSISSAKFATHFTVQASLATIKRVLQKLVFNDVLIKTGEG